MNLKKNCQNCFWYDSCAQDGGDFCGYTPMDDSELLEMEYREDLHMQAEEYQHYIDEMNGDA